MRYTVPIVAEKALQLLGAEPLQLHFGAEADINGFSTATRDRRRPDILWLNDNSGGSRPYSACGAKHCIHIASRTEEAGWTIACEPDRSLIVLPHSVPLRRLVAAMEQCFSFYNAWSDGLLDIVCRGGDWYELLAAGHRVLNNPMIIYNRSMRILAYTVDDGTQDPLWSDTVRSGVAHVDSERESAELMRFLSQVERHDAPFRFQGEGMSDPFWCAPVQVAGRPGGMVNAVEYHRPLSPGDCDLLRIFAQYVAVCMRNAAVSFAIPDAAPRQLMLDLLSGKIASRDRLNARLLAVDWRALEHQRFVSLRSALPFLPGEQWRAIHDQLIALGLNGLCCMIGESELHIGLLQTSATPERFGQTDLILEQFCSMNHLRAGVSDSFTDLMDAPRYYRQAEAALELSQETICPYGSARYPRLLRHLRRHPHREDLMHPAVIALSDRDREEGTAYLPTLQALILHAFNQVETAEALGIHRTTLAYRLRRIQELTALDLSDPRQVFHVAVSLKLI